MSEPEIRVFSSEDVFLFHWRHLDLADQAWPTRSGKAKGKPPALLVKTDNPQESAFFSW